jgi:hypothetical protein
MPSTVWRMGGLPLVQGQAIAIGPGLKASVSTDAEALRDCGVAGGTIRLAVVHANGTSLKKYEIDVTYSSGSTSGSPVAQGVRGVSGRRTVELRAPEPAAEREVDPPDSVPALAPAPAPTSAEPTGGIETSGHILEVRYVGGMAGRLSLRLTLPGSAVPKRETFEVGEEIAYGWYIVSVQQSPDAIIVRKGSVGAAVTILRGGDAAQLAISLEHLK